MRKAVLLLAVLAIAGKAKGQVTFDPLTTLCSRTAETSYCSNVQSADGQYSFSFGNGSIAVYHEGTLALTASDLVLSVTQVGPASWYDTFYRVDGTFSGGTFTIYMEVIRKRMGAGRYIQTLIYTYLQGTYGTETSVVKLN
jgi:hypothetical protein